VQKERNKKDMIFYSAANKLLFISYRIGIWVGTWGRGFRCGASDFCFSFKNAARATVPWLWPLPQRSVFFET
jgi:hypothetical protein